MIPKRIYLAAPYSSRDAAIREARVDWANLVAGKLMQRGAVVFSPLSHSHPIAERMRGVDNCDHNFWLAQDLPYLVDWADEMWVLAIPGWQESFGIHIERVNAQEFDIPLHHIFPDMIDLIPDEWFRKEAE